MVEAGSDKPVRRTPRRVVAALAVTAAASAVFGTGLAFAQSGGVGSPGGTAAPAPTTAPAGAMVFPVAGAHTIGQGFGAARSGGRRHEGQDIMSACGTPLVAVSRAKVKFVSFQSLAGNYVVIRNKRLHQDYMYAHLATRASVTKGQVVQPGQQIGIVGQTGDATACHLHFELWLGKWYRGGHPVNPLPYLQAYAGY
ncbi:MAG TPA: M23 family metallopeptidase [Solirubrobacterales bacterium]|jgi:murein DD-endopeptidase MepM/ murein hydrolase activator NlpD|nr:M23 family metallopeptidase [Solirubrobacterales bacterium]